MVSIRVSAYDPDGIQVQKSINANHHTQEEIQRIEIAFKKHIHAGKNAKEFRIADVLKSTTPSNSPEKPINAIETVEKESIFPHKKFSSLKLPENNNMSFCLIGSTRSGKTYAMNSIWETIFKKHITILMTHSGHADIYKDLRKNCIISDGFHKELIDEPMKINKLTKDHYQFCLIFDDLGMDGKISDSMTNLLTRGRNCGQSAIICGQKMTMLSSTGRTNINYILCFKQNTDSEIEATIKCFLRSYFPKSMKIVDMISAYRKLTEDHNFICIDTLNNDIFISKI